MTASAQAIDLSNWNSKAGEAFDIAGAKAKIPSLVLVVDRVTQGLGAPGTGSPDSTAGPNWAAARALGLDVGGYHFLDPRLSGAAQAKYFLETADKLPGGVNWRVSLWCDNETAGASVSQVADCAAAFMQQLDADRPHGCQGVYTFINFALAGNCKGLGKYLLWLAYPSSAAPHEPPPWAGPQMVWWQYGQRDGVDADGFMRGTVTDYHTFVQTFEPKPASPGGPYRHVSNPLESFAQLAARRHTTVDALLQLSAKHYTAADRKTLEHAHGFRIPYYTENP